MRQCQQTNIHAISVPVGEEEILGQEKVFEKIMAKFFCKFDEKYKLIYPTSSMNAKQDKENHIKAQHDQIVENQ